MKTASFSAWEEKGRINVRQTEQHVRGPGGSMDHPMEEVKDQRNGRKEQQEMWLKRWGGEEGIQQIHSPI